MFHWRYIALPAAILLLSLALTAYFYRLLPGEVAYHFRDGLPDRWMSRGAITAWLLAPQFILTLMAGAIAWGIAMLSLYLRQAPSPWMKRMLTFMGNMFALPQLILGFATLQIFSYNCYQIYFMPLGTFALMVMGLGAVILAVFFTLAIRKVQQSRQESAR